MFSERTRKIIAFLRLIRIHKPIPIFLLIFPGFIVMFSEIFSVLKNYEFENYKNFLDKLGFSPISLSLKIFFGGFIVRSLGCILNDFFDRDIDSNSKRSEKRPFVQNENNQYKLSPFEPIVLFGSFFLSLAGLLIMLSLKFSSIVVCLIAVLLTLLYPLTKRFLSVPQIFLGFTYAMPVLIIGSEVSLLFKISHIILYLGVVFYIFSYDSIYAIQDLKDDIKNKMNSAPVKFGANLSVIISKAYNLSFILFLVFGILEFSSYGFYISIALGFIFIKFLIKDLDSKENFQLQRIFEMNTFPLLFIIFGLLIDISFLLFFKKFFMI